jgi:hypothetical protein
MTEQEWWKCPHCGEEKPAFAFHLVGRFVPGFHPGQRRRCSACDQISSERSLRKKRRPAFGVPQATTRDATAS